MEGSGGKAFCKCEDGWTCTITQTDPSKSGKSYSDCSGGPCSCDTKDDTKVALSQAELAQALGGLPPANSKALCVCPEGWSCVVSKTSGVDAGKAFFECGESCTCVIDEDETVKLASA